MVSHLLPWRPIVNPAQQRDVRVGVILDSFSEQAFAPEWHQVLLKPGQWRDQLDDLDMVFIESAWHGNNDAWQYALTPKPWDKLKEMVAESRRRGIPTVFWNKEDPVHFEDFIQTAALFDHVFTTDVNKVDDYKKHLGHDNVGVLGFAAQPAIHSPVRPEFGHATRDIAFAGMYFAHKYPERREQMKLLLGAASKASARREMDTGLEIFSRFLGRDKRYQFPKPLSKHVIGSVDYQKMLSAYRLYKVFLNVNSVVDSPSMCARRIFELLACGTSVVTTPSPAVREFFPAEELTVVDNPEDAENALRALVKSPELRDRMNHLAARRIWAEHTYGHRVDTVLEAVGLEAKKRHHPKVSVICSTIRKQQIDHVLNMAAAQVNVDLQLCILAHGFPAEGIKDKAEKLGLDDVVVLEGDSGDSLGHCLNRLVDASDGEVIAKWDDDDIYGPHYLEDQLNALMFSAADVVGKQAHFTWLEQRGLTALTSPEREHKFTHFVAGPTLVFPRETAQKHRFLDVSTGEDTAFLRSVVAAEGRIYTADRFNFIRIRGGEGHTWRRPDNEFLANSRVISFDDITVHVMV
ncbi:glycosyltransferase [Corynebacterium sp. CCM 8862]|uniref:Glycosyltransferase n=2 Tax=Corynebacterium mendelii TaxID=2765362 RepID=A0A939E1K5_9CORY|nr:glycosyltransferase [Corynebacterium mendelii]MBN9645295.1 glycosyltransferase [Corynebacterium mendelii]